MSQTKFTFEDFGANFSLEKAFKRAERLISLFVFCYFLVLKIDSLFKKVGEIFVYYVL